MFARKYFVTAKISNRLKILIFISKFRSKAILNSCFDCATYKLSNSFQVKCPKTGLSGGTAVTDILREFIWKCIFLCFVVIICHVF